MEDKISNGYQLPSMDLLDDYTKYVLDSELEINPSTNKESVIQILDEYKILCSEAFVPWKIKFPIGEIHIGFP